MKNKFIDFLIKQKIYDDWCECFEKDLDNLDLTPDEFLDTYSACSYIFNAFAWGFDRNWPTHNNLWGKICNE